MNKEVLFFSSPGSCRLWVPRMRRCCCCVSVHAGSVVLGLLGVVLAGLELAVLIPYLMDVDPDEFNPIQGNLHRCFYFVSKAIQDVGNASKEIIGDSLSFDHNEVSHPHVSRRVYCIEISGRKQDVFLKNGGEVELM